MHTTAAALPDTLTKDGLLEGAARSAVDQGDLIRPGGYEVNLRPVAGSLHRSLRTPLHRARADRRQGLRIARLARQQTGLSIGERRQLLGDAATDQPNSDLAGAGALLVCSNTFAVHGAGSLEGSNKRSNEDSNDRERSLEPSPMNTSSLLADDGAEDWRTGTD